MGVLVDSSLILLSVKRINSACGIYHLGDTAAVLRSNLLALTVKYLKVLQVFEHSTNSCDRMSTCIVVQYLVSPDGDEKILPVFRYV